MKKLIKVIYILILAVILSSVINVNYTYCATNSVVNAEKELENERKANKYLSSLKIEGYELLPEFNKNTLEYTVIIPNDVKTLEIDAVPEIDGAKVKISGNTKLTKQENTITLRVTALNGTSRSYIITAIKEPKVTLKLESLNVEGIELNPVFDKDIFIYNASLEDTEMVDANITAVANDENAKVEIIGNKNLIDGHNLINIVLSNDDETTIYQLNLQIDKLGEKEKETTNIITKIRNTLRYTTIGLIILLGLVIFLIIISVIIKKVRRKNYDEDDEE